MLLLLSLISLLLVQYPRVSELARGARPQTHLSAVHGVLVVRLRRTIVSSVDDYCRAYHQSTIASTPCSADSVIELCIYGSAPESVVELRYCCLLRCGAVCLKLTMTLTRTEALEISVISSTVS